MDRQFSLPTKDIQIFADYREKEIIELLEKLGIKVNIVKLDVCDFVYNDIGIERKTFSDFISSILDGRIFHQTKKMIETYEKRIIIVEGFENLERVNENYYLSILGYLAINKISVIFTKSKMESAKLIYWILKKENDSGKKNYFSYRIRKKEENLVDIQKRILSSFPGISLVLSERIIKKFKSIRNFVLASERDLMKIDGIGEKLSKKIKKIIDFEYKGD
ncbi:MAG: ERCC4 domain-containing protein [Candidatus Aenigmatarchaeota archaeon]